MSHKRKMHPTEVKEDERIPQEAFSVVLKISTGEVTRVSDEWRIRNSDITDAERNILEQVNGIYLFFLNRLFFADFLRKGFNVGDMPDSAYGVLWRLDSDMLEPWDESEKEKVAESMNTTSNAKVEEVKDKWHEYLQNHKKKSNGLFTHWYTFFVED